MIFLLISQTYVPIDSIQGITLPGSDSSAYAGQTVTTSGIVTEVGRYGSGFHIQMKQGGPYSGIFVFMSDTTGLGDLISIGDSVVVTGTVQEYYHLTEIRVDTLTDIAVISSGHNFYIDTVRVINISTAAPDSAEMYEGVFVYIDSASVTDAQTYYYTITDGSAYANVSTRNIALAVGDMIRIRGVLVYEFSQYRLVARDMNDVEYIEPYPVVSIDSIQRTVIPGTDSSIFNGQTVKTTGIVTEVGSFGRGFHIQMKQGGPYSGIYVYTPDYTNYVVGDSVVVVGQVQEYYDYTEISAASIEKIAQNVSFYVDTVATSTVSTSNPNTAEMYEGVAIFIEKAAVVDTNDRYVYSIKNSSLPALLARDGAPTLSQNDIISLQGILAYSYGEYRVFIANSRYTLYPLPYRLSEVAYGYRDTISFTFIKQTEPVQTMTISFSAGDMDTSLVLDAGGPDSITLHIPLNGLARGYYQATLTFGYIDTTGIVYNLPYPNGFSCLVINEFDDYPTNEEFVEFINACDYPVNLGGLRVKSYAGSNTYYSSQFPAIELQPGEVYAFSYYPERCDTNCQALTNWTYFNSYQPMAVITPEGFAVDSLYYESYWGGRDPYTTIRVDVNAPGWTAQAWGQSAYPGGTPGRPNAIQPPAKTGTIEILSRDLKVGDRLVFSFTLPKPSRSVYIYLYDDAGRYVDRIYYENNFEIEKDVASYDTALLKPGIYIIAVTADNSLVTRKAFRLRRK